VNEGEGVEAGELKEKKKKKVCKDNGERARGYLIKIRPWVEDVPREKYGLQMGGLKKSSLI